MAQGRRQLERHLTGLSALGGLSQRLRVLIEDMRRQWCELDGRIAEFDKELAEWARSEEAARRLMRPDTLMQTGQIIVSKSLASGARHTF